MMCDRCLEQMRDEEAEAIVVSGATGPGATIHVHRQPCRPTPRQTSPVRA